MKAKAFVLGFIFAVFFLVSFCYSQVPQMMNYQGKLTTPTGAIIDTTVSMEFKIYDDSIGGTILWSETQSSVVVEYGVFSILLGSVNPIPFDIWGGGHRYLGIKVGTSPEMIPRKPMVSVPFAFTTAKGDCWDCNTLGVTYLVNPNDNVGIGTTSPEGKLHVLGSRVKFKSPSNYDQELLIVNSSEYGVEMRTDNNTGDVIFSRYQNGSSFQSMTLQNSSGNVGIGTTSPEERLQISNEGNFQLETFPPLPTYSNDVTLPAQLQFGHVTFSPSPGYSENSDPIYFKRINPDDNISGLRLVIGDDYLPANAPYRDFFEIGAFHPFSTEFHSIFYAESGDGRVGIGTTTPANKLDVEGGVAVGPTYSGTSSAPSNGMIIEGDVGIGTKEPLVRLTVRDSVPDPIPRPYPVVHIGRFVTGYGHSAIYLGSETADNPYVPGQFNFNLMSDGGDLRINRPAGYRILFERNHGAWTQMVIDDGGNVGIGGFAAQNPTQKLDIDGTARLRSMPDQSANNDYVVVDGDGVLRRGEAVGSSKRYKENIRNLEVNPENVLQLNPVRFQWKTSGTEDIGLIAEDVETTIPDLVIYDKEGKPDGVKYDKVAIYLLQVVKAQQERILSLEKQIAELKK